MRLVLLIISSILFFASITSADIYECQIRRYPRVQCGGSDMGTLLLFRPIDIVPQVAINHRFFMKSFVAVPQPNDQSQTCNDGTSYKRLPLYEFYFMKVNEKIVRIIVDYKEMEGGKAVVTQEMTAETGIGMGSIILRHKEEVFNEVSVEVSCKFDNVVPLPNQ